MTFLSRVHRARRRPGRVVRSEQGSALAIAIVAMTLISLIAVALFGLEDTTLKSQTGLVDKRKMDLGADNALETAIAALRADSTATWGTEYDTSCDPVTYTPTGVPGKVVVQCVPQEESGSPKGSAGYPPDNVIVTLGGMAWNQDGDDDGDPSSVKVPFCDDYRVAGGRCEPGIWIGTSDDESGGLLVVPNGSKANDALVKTNGSLVLKDGTRSRDLRVQGDVWARRECDKTQIKVDYDPGTGTWDNSANPVGLKCQQGDSSGPAPNNADLLRITDPEDAYLWWIHDEWPRTDRAAATPGTPNPVDTTPTALPGIDPRLVWSPNPATNPLIVPESATNPKMVGGIPKYPNGASAMTDCSDGYVEFQSGRYTSIEALNTMMSSCDSTPYAADPVTYYFKPGTYYFDFEDVNTANTNKWREPKDFSQFIGGTPYAAGQPHAWNPCICPQADHTMVTDKNNPTPDVNWDYDAVNLSRTTEIDGDKGVLQWNNGSVLSTSLEQRKLRTPVPLTATSVSSVKVRVAHSYVTSTAFDDYAENPGVQKPRVEIRVEGVASCYVTLNGGTPTTLSNGKVTDVETIDITGGCPGVASNTNWPNTDAEWRTVDSGKLWVNKLKVKYEAKRDNNSVFPSASFDGQEVVVNYTGPPAPDFPGGCDPTKPGVQFIFGGLGHWEWIGNDLYAEFCGSKGLDPRGIAIYGLSAETTPVPRRYETSHRANLGVVSGGTTWSLFPLPTPTAGVDSYETVNYNAATPSTILQTAAPWTDATMARATFQVPYGTIPDGSYIENVMLKVTHSEARTGTAITTDFDALRIHVDPASTAAGPSDWESCGAILNLDSTTPGFLTKNATMHTDIYGDVSSERKLTDELCTANAINGAVIEFEVDPYSTGFAKTARIDAVELIVEYRPKGSLRPVRGCMTIRPSDDPAARGYVGTDPSWGVTNKDESYAQGTDLHDGHNCGLVVFRSNTAAEGAKVHVAGALYAPTAAVDLSGKDNEASFVTDGLVVRHLTALRWRRTPETPAFGGGTTTEADPREVVIEARYDPDADGDVAEVGSTLLARARVQIVDYVGGVFKPGDSVTKMCWLRKPTLNSLATVTGGNPDPDSEKYDGC